MNVTPAHPALEPLTAPAELPFEEAFDAAGTGMALGGPDGRFVKVNAQLTGITGYSEAELLAGGAPLLWGGGTASAARASLAELWSGGSERYDAERRYRHKDGRELWVSTAAICLREPDGRPRFVLGQFQDITSRVHSQLAFAEAAASARASQRRYDAVLDRIDEVVFQLDNTGRWTFLSSAWTRATGQSVSGSLGRPARDFLHPDDRAAFADVLLPVLRRETERVEFECRYPVLGGETHWAEVEAHLVTDAEDGVVAVGGLIRDVTSRHEAEREARAHVESLVAVAAVTRAINEGDEPRHAVCHAAREVTGAAFAALVESDGGGFVSTAMDGLEVSPIRISGAVRESPFGRTLAAGERVFFPDARVFRAIVPAGSAVATARSGLFQPVHRGGAIVAILCLAWEEPVPRLPDRHAAAIALLAAEAGGALERADMLAQLASLARTDALTGLANRGAWDTDLARELAHARRTGLPLCVAMLDLDFFKAWNDAHGHQAGDDVLTNAGRAWLDCLREGDLLARWGGEEFAIALPGCDADAAHVIVERCRAALPPGVTCSAGLARWDGEEDAASLIGRVDAALYRAKAHGRDRTSVS